MGYILFDNDFCFFDSGKRKRNFFISHFYDTYYLLLPMICYLSAFFCYLGEVLFLVFSRVDVKIAKVCLSFFTLVFSSRSWKKSSKPFFKGNKIKLKLINLCEGIKVDPLYLYASLSLLSYFFTGKSDTLTSDSLYCYSIKNTLASPFAYNLYPVQEAHWKSAKLKFYGAKEREQKIAFNWCECVIKKKKRKRKRQKCEKKEFFTVR